MGQYDKPQKRVYSFIIYEHNPSSFMTKVIKEDQQANDPVVQVLLGRGTEELSAALAQLPWKCTVRTYSDPEHTPLADSIAILTSEQLRQTLAEGESRLQGQTAIILYAASGDPGLGNLLENPDVVGLIEPSSSHEALLISIKAGLQRLGQIDGLHSTEMLERILEIGRALAAEKDLDTLLNLILTHTRSITGADGASIYTLDIEGRLYFRLWQNASTTTMTEAQKTLVGDYSVAGYVARSGKPLNIDDAYAIPESSPYRFNPASDRSLDYHTRSMLTLPLINKKAEVVGILQLINRKSDADLILKNDTDFKTKTMPFDDQSIQVALALAGQAGVAIENSNLYADIERLFEGFIKASVKAIEARDPTTAGHSFRVANFTERLAKAVDRNDGHRLRDIFFTVEQMREIRYAALLHDFGKVGVREDVLVKAKKLHPQQLALLKQRFNYARACIERDAFKALIVMRDEESLSPEEFAVKRREIEQLLVDESRQLEENLRLILKANEPTISYAEIEDQLKALTTYTFKDETGQAISLLQTFEFADLSLTKGSLNEQERREIESHVSHTFSFLKLIPWTSNLSKLPEIAYAHHEKLDGSGYPRGISATDIPVQSKIMTIADIFDALTAGDRPYKQALPREHALDILSEEAKAGKIDRDLYQVFLEARAYESAIT